MDHAMNQTINISLPKGLIDLARQQVKSGYYSSVSEVIRDAMRKYSAETSYPTIKLSKKAEAVFDKGLEEYHTGKSTRLKSTDDLDKI